jgi:hypothetical protein
VAVPLTRYDRSIQRNLAPNLLGVIVGNGGPLFYFTQPAGGTRIEDHGLGQRGLSGATVRDKGDVPYLLGLVTIRHQILLTDGLWLIADS